MTVRTPRRRADRLASAVDDRFGAAPALRKNLIKVFPDHWSFLLGEIALYSLFVLLGTGVFLTFFFEPSMGELVYHGSYRRLDGMSMSEAYASTLRISFDVRGGLLVRQMHHWAALIFTAAIMTHLLRIFFTGAFRKPREVNWLIGVTLLVLAIAEGFGGYSLPDDLLSGTGLRIAQGFLQSIPVVGTYVMFFLFGGEFPGHQIIPRLFAGHVLLLPGLILALVGAHLLIIWHQKHTQWASREARPHNVVGGPTYPAFAAKTVAFQFFVFGVTAMLATFVQINPIWLYGPYNPLRVSTGSQPDWYMGWIEGALRIWPPWEIDFGGHTLMLNVFLPSVVVPVVFFALVALYPFAEGWVTGDRYEHHICDRPRDVPVRAAIGAAGISVFAVLTAAGGNDVFADRMDIPLEATTWFFRIAVFVVPVSAAWLAFRACRGLRRREDLRFRTGRETGIVDRLPSGEYVEVVRPYDEEAVITARVSREAALRARPIERRNPLLHPIARLRHRLNRRYAATEPVPLDRSDDPR